MVAEFWTHTFFSGLFFESLLVDLFFLRGRGFLAKNCFNLCMDGKMYSLSIFCRGMLKMAIKKIRGDSLKTLITCKIHVQRVLA
jgi:hypothetical protein